MHVKVLLLISHFVHEDWYAPGGNAGADTRGNVFIIRTALRMVSREASFMLYLLFNACR